MERLRAAEERVAAAWAEGGAALEAALRERFAARRALIEAGAGALDRGGRDRITRILARYAGEPVEHLLIFDGSGRVLLHAAGDQTSVWFPPGDLPSGRSAADQWQGAVVAHTHPISLQAGVNAQDLLTCSRLEVCAAAIVSYQAGSLWVQWVDAPDGWPDAETLWHRWLASYNEVARSAAVDDPFHAATEQTARALRLSYRREPLP